MDNKVTLTQTRLIVEPVGLDKVWSLKNKLEVPLHHVVGATIDPEILDSSQGLRSPGLHTPGKWAGTYTQAGEKAFINVTRPSIPVVVHLADEQYTHLILGVENPRELVDLINTTIVG